MKRFLSALLAAGCVVLVWKSTPGTQPAPERKTQHVATTGEAPAPRAQTTVQRASESAASGFPALRQDVRWRQVVAEPEFAGFKAWAAEFADGKRSLEEGVELAQERRAALGDMISKDPRRALELAVPESVRRALPAAVQAELEERVSGRGDLQVAAAVALPEREHEVTAVMRSVTIAGREFETFTFGNRESAMSRRGLAIHGIALDGRLALSEWPARVLEPVEAAEARAKLRTPPLCPVSGAVLDANGDEIVLDWSMEQAQWYCQAGHAMQELYAAAAAEAALPPGVAANGVGGGGVDLPVAESGYTEGTKSMLIIRVDFPDKAGQVVSDTTLTSLINNMADHWTKMSYGKLNWKRAGEGSAFTPTLRLPNGHASYTGFGTMLNAARAAAEDAGFDYRDYSFEVVVTGDKPDVSFGGVAFVGGRGSWLANGSWNLGVCSHEVGHNFGLNHSGFWDTTDGTPIGAGANVEYGNPFDHMGGASSSTNAHFNARQKNYLDWMPDASVKKITANGTVTQRITAMDRDDATGFRAIAVDRAGTSQDYWIEYRSLYTSNKWIKDGVVVNFGDVGINNGKPSLLDFAPATSTKDDCAILIGRTFSDSDKGIHITPTGRGTGTDGVPYMDVTVNRGTFTGNRKPVAALNFSPSNPAVNANASFTATASDPDGDALSYFWDWGDGTFTANNATTNSHDWDSAGIRTVRCTVSDMKGLAATASVLVQVGTSTTFFISGYVRTAAGVPLESVTVSAGGRSDATDSEGFFAVTGLSAGSHTVSAAKTGFVFNVSGFANPVSVGPSRTNINFSAPPGSPVIGAIKPGLVDAGSNTGAVKLVLSDNDTPITALTLSAVSSNTALIPQANIAFGTADPRTVTVTALSGGSGVVNLTITATDPENSSSSYVWPVTVNAPPVHALSAQSTPENIPLDMDLRALVADDRTPDDGIAFRMDRVRNGSVQLLPDGSTARFTPSPDFNGAASFRLTSRDQSLSSRTLLLYDFEPDAQGDVITRGTVPDLSNFDRTGTLESEGNGEYAAVADVPPPLAPHSTVALNLTENGGGGAAKLKRVFTAAELNWNDADWTFCAWVKRTTTITEDFVFHLGDGDGHGADDELELYFAAGTNELKLEKWNAGGAQASMVHPGVPAGEWHYLSITFDRTAANTGTLTLSVDGFPAGTAAGVSMAVDQTRSMVVGGHAETTSLTHWLDGRVDDVMLAGSVLSRGNLRTLATMGTAHFLGLSDTDTVNVTVTGANHAPAITPPADAGMNTGLTSAALPFFVGDAESEARALTVTGTSSDTTLIPNAGIVIGSAPPAWSSADIGTVGAAGSTVEDHGTFLISGSGVGTAGAADEFRFVSQDQTGDGELICRVVSVDFVNQNSRAGLMLRAGTAADAPFAMIGITAGDGVQFSSRVTAGATTVSAASVNFIAAPVWLRLVRSGGTVTGYYAEEINGVRGAWHTGGFDSGFTLPATVKAGVAVTSFADASLTTATVDSVGGSLKTGGERTLTLTPAPGRTGIATITLRVSDGSATTPANFQAVVGVNTPPTITPVADITLISGQTPAAFNVTLGDLHTAATALTFTSSSSNSLLLPNNRIVIIGTGAARTVQLRPVPGETGTATVTLSVNDGTVSTPVTFVLTANPGDPALLVSAGTNWRYLDTGVVPPAWNTAGFNDSAWPIGPAQLGFGEGDESTPVNANAARKTTYFRRAFQLADPALYQWIGLNVLRDDGAVIYLNGQEIWRTNLPGGIAITATTDALVAVGGADESRFFPFTARRAPFVAGMNVIAVELHQKGTTSSDLSFDLEARGLNPSPIEAIAPGVVWTYLDTGADPGNGWTDVSFVETGWKSGPAQFGYGDGDEVTLIEGGPDNARNVTTWFRKRFDLADKNDLAGMGLRVLRDDGIQVWLNGEVLYRDNLPAGATASTLATTAIGAAAENQWQTIWLSPDLLAAGANQFAAEVHQASATSTDVSFDLQLLLFTHDSLPPLNASVLGNNIVVTWPLWAAAWRVQSSPDLRAWANETAVPAAGANLHSLTLPRTAARKYFRLALP